MTTLTNAKPSFLRRLVASFGRLDRLTKIFLIAFVVAGIATGMLAFGFVRQFVESSPSFTLPGLAIHEDSTSPSGEDITPEAETVYGYQEPVPWDGSSRVNILIMGLDARDWEAGDNAPRTDTMMVLTFDPITHTAGMLSIPRDLWAEIPGFGHDKINNAYSLGESNRLPGGGAGLAVKAVEEFLGITINYYAQIDFSAFERFIDIIGGVKIYVEEMVEVSIIGRDGTRKIRPGWQTLDGAYALAYARTRYTGNGDFDRAQRQQEVILAMRNQLAHEDIRARVLNNALEIYDTLASGITTNMTVQEALSLAWSAKDIKVEEIEQAIIAPPEYVTIQTSPDGLSILKPITEKIRLLRDQVFASGSARSQLALTSQAVDLMKMEAANVVVNNGSGNAGVADTTRAYFEGQGMIIVSTGNADAVNGTTLIDYTGNPYTLQFLAALMGVNASHIFNRYDPNSTVDVEIIIGPEWVIPQ